MINHLEENKPDSKNSEKEISIVSPSKNQGLFGRLLDRIKSSLTSPKNVPAGSLQGRIQTSPTKQASKVLDQFLSIAQEFEKHLDEELIIHVKAAMDLIRRDFRRIQKKAANVSDKESEEVFHAWMTKAKRWIELDNKLHDRAAIIDIIIKQHFSDLEELIDQDLQVIFDYEANSLADLTISEDEKRKLEEIILNRISPYTQALIKLKECPTGIDLYKVAQWKEEIDKNRQKYFEKALHAIDSVIADQSIKPREAEEKSMLTGLEEEIETLKQSTLKLLMDVQQEQSIDEKKKYISILLPMQQKAHQLNGNLHLSHELFELLQEVQIELDRIEQILGQ